ncbi:MAG: hypothetical protein AAFQ94_25430 [Bacteroidota bacterium]
MSAIFRKSGLIQNDELSLDIAPDVFKKVLEYNLDPTGFKFFGVFSKSRNQYKGKVDDQSFTLIEKRSLFQLRSALIRIEGQYEGKNKQTAIFLTVNGINNHLILIYLLFIAFYCVGFSVIFRMSDSQAETNYPIYFAIALTAHMMLQFSAPIIAKRKKVERFKNNLENTFQEMIMKYNSKSSLA